MFDFERHVVKIPLQVSDVSLEEGNKFHGQSQNFSTLLIIRISSPVNPRAVHIVATESEKKKKKQIALTITILIMCLILQQVTLLYICVLCCLNDRKQTSNNTDWFIVLKIILQSMTLILP